METMEKYLITNTTQEIIYFKKLLMIRRRTVEAKLIHNRVGGHILT